MSSKQIELPEFPEFRPIKFEVKDSIERVTHRLPPYSDFNFNSLHSWNVDGKSSASLLNDNLVISMADYQAEDTINSIIGTNNTNETVFVLLDYLEQNGHDPVLRLVAETVVSQLDGDIYDIQEDRDSFDYIYNMEDMSNLSGKKFKSKRRSAQKCRDSNRVEVVTYNKSERIENGVFSVVAKWKLFKTSVPQDELDAITRMLKRFNEQDSVIITGVYFDDELAGFSIDEKLPDNYVQSHYSKTLPFYNGISEYLNQELAKKLHSEGYEHWNWEQDLGIEGLRAMKEGYKPVRFLKKYSVTRRKDC